MKKLAMVFALPAALFFASGAFAQDAEKEDLTKKSNEQLKEEYKDLTKDVSRGMKKVGSGLEKAALPKRKADELRVELNKMLDALKKGEADELHGGVKQYFEDNPQKLADLLKMTRKEAVKLIEDDEALLKKLAENAEKTSKLFKDLNFLDDVLKRQAELDKSMRSVRKALERGKKTEAKIEKVLDLLQENERRKKP